MENALREDGDDHEEIVSLEEVEELEQHLPKSTCNNGNIPLVKYEGFWLITPTLQNVIAIQRHFQARDSDIIIASMPKTGNTWLKALLFAVVNRPSVVSPNITQDVSNNVINMITKKHPHELVYCLENEVYGKGLPYPHPHQLDELPSPRLFHTHISYTSLPESMRNSGCRIVYIVRNPLDTAVSLWHFFVNLVKTMMGEEFLKLLGNIEDSIDDFIEGRIIYGSFFDHVLEYWKQSLEQPNKVFFVKYEDLCDDPTFELKRLADFVGLPFSAQEESDGVIEHIINLCSFDNLKNLEVNKTGVINKHFEKKSYFRKGKVGDWVNHFTPEIGERMNKLMKEKFDGSGLSFKPY